MHVGGKRTLIILPDLDYGVSAAGGVISPGATLIFDLDLLGVKWLPLARRASKGRRPRQRPLDRYLHSPD